MGQVCNRCQKVGHLESAVLKPKRAGDKPQKSTRRSPTKQQIHQLKNESSSDSDSDNFFFRNCAV